MNLQKIDADCNMSLYKEPSRPRWLRCAPQYLPWYKLFAQITIALFGGGAIYFSVKGEIFTGLFMGVFMIAFIFILNEESKRKRDDNYYGEQWDNMKDRITTLAGPEVAPGDFEAYDSQPPDKQRILQNIWLKYGAILSARDNQKSRR